MRETRGHFTWTSAPQADSTSERTASSVRSKGGCSAASAPAGSPTLSVSGEALGWTSVECAGAYDVVRGELVSLQATGGDFTASTMSCVANDTTGLSLPSAQTPSAPGHVTWILVRAANCAGLGTFEEGGAQSGSRDAEILASSFSCPWTHPHRLPGSFRERHALGLHLVSHSLVFKDVRVALLQHGSCQIQVAT